MKKVLVSFYLLIIIGQVMAAEPRCIECNIAQKKLQEEAGRVDKRPIGGGDSGDLYSTGGDASGGGRSISGQDSGGRSKNRGEGGEDGKTI